MATIMALENRNRKRNQLALAAGGAGVALAALLAWLLWPPAPAVGEVEGVVTMDGRPLPFVEVVFLPDSTAGGRGPASSAVTDGDGKYRLGADDGRAGVPTGVHRVIVLEARPDPDVKPKGWDKQPPRVPASYSGAVTTPFVGVEVKAGKQTRDLQMTTAPGKSQTK